MGTIRSQRRTAILEHATQRASSHGLDGLTLGGLAGQLGVSKGGIQGLFGTKAQLQLETLQTASRIFDERVLAVDERIADGLPRLRALMNAWVDYLDDTFEGGCFFYAAAVELDSHPGPLRDALVRFVEHVRRALRRQAHLAQRLGEMPAETDLDQLVFDLHGAILAANFARQLFGDHHALDRARTAIDRRLEFA